MSDIADMARPSRLSSWADRAAQLEGWRRVVAAMALGCLAGLALPPLHLIVLLWPAFTGLLLLLRDTSSLKRAFWTGGCFGFGYFALGLYWVGIAFLVDVERFGFVMPFAVAGLAAGLAIFTALTTMVVVATRTKGLARLSTFAASWVFFEWLRSWVFTGFPWNLAGTVWSFSPEMLQLAAFLGVWGLSAMTLLAAGAPVVWLASSARFPRAQRLVSVAFLLLPLLAWGGGYWRLAAAPPQEAHLVPGVTLRLVQPAIEQSLKWEPELRRKHLLDQMRLSREPGIEKVTHLVWSETAVPYYLSSEPALLEALSTIVPVDGLLITGALRQGDQGDGPYNSLFALDHRGAVRGVYDKFHLVPFGEYAPFRELLDVAKLTAGSVDFQPGPGPKTLPLPGFPAISPLICYEVIFPGAVTQKGQDVGARPGLLLNVTNDAWFGLSSGPYQHFATAKLRAVEEGLPLVRAANNGISGVIDAYGREVATLGLNQKGFLDSPLPKPTKGITLYATIGNNSVFVILLFIILTALIFRRLGI